MHLSGRTRVAGLILLLSAISSALPANDAGPTLQLASGQELEIQRFAGSGKSLLLWLPSERGFRPAHREHARALAQLGYEAWLADLHDAYFVERNRRSIASFPLDDVVDIIDAAVAASKAGVFLISGSRGAQLSLIAAREWQQQNPGKASLKGVFLVHAHLYRARPAAAKSASYLPIVSATNLPVYLLDTQYSTRSARIGELAEALAQSPDLDEGRCRGLQCRVLGHPATTPTLFGSSCAIGAAPASVPAVWPRVTSPSHPAPGRSRGRW